MRILFNGEEYQISGLASGKNIYGTPKPVIVGGIPVAMNGVLCEGVEDITQYDEDGNEVIPKAPHEILPENTKEWTIAMIKLFMDGEGIAYNSGDTKLDLVNKTRLFFGLAPV